MTHDEIRAGVMAALLTIAPELAGEPLAPERALREQADLDSMDWLNVIVDLHRRFGVDIPESDYARLTTLDGIVTYLAQRIAGGNPPSGR